jgi:hypothetical protein
MLKAGDFFLCGNSGGVMGAVIPHGKGYMGVAPAHIFRLAGTSQLRIGNQKAKVSHFSPTADLAYFPLLAASQPSVLEKPNLGEASLENVARKMDCRVSDVSWSVVYIVLQPRNLPGPGDSGTPLIQEGEVKGMLLSINLGTCRGIVVSSEIIKSEAPTQ